MSRAAALFFAIVSYAVFFATFLYLIAFVGDLPVPKTVDSPPSTLAPIAASLIDLALIALFGVQHSVMARPGFKRSWTRMVPPAVERSVYVLFASIALLILFWFWQPIAGTVWLVSPNAGWLVFVLWAALWAGFGIVLISTFLINHFELFGLQQAWLNMRRQQAEAPELRQPFFYKWVAHPLYAGFFLAFWSTPHMTLGHLLLAIGLSIYMLVAIRYEELDLTDLFGEDYRRYRAGVGMLVPRFGRRST
ncbi:MAG TPA: isoprenylcysteine carboxylmethyltransferase family protein [Sphingomicrobium sp.]|jgi:protein-S-isoprenylcysteine O-methyltransferase Ste14|nr:isoprenylcysteine carboxylmethyltransferase family protein [Sphingomicrobium sp.]